MPRKPTRRREPAPKILRSPLTVAKDETRVSILGVYTLPYYGDILVVEVIVEAADPLDACGYAFSAPSYIQDDTAPGEPMDVGQEEFWLTPDGEKLLGYPWDQRPLPPGPTRFAFLLYGTLAPFTLTTPGGKVRIYRTEPIPERLLRLIWVEALA